MGNGSTFALASCDMLSVSYLILSGKHSRRGLFG
jgi:hypothetical protein